MDNSSYSPSVMLMIVEAAARLGSFADAAYALGLAKIDISPRHVARLCRQIGNELVQQRDHKVMLRRRRQLPVALPQLPQFVAVEVDGGRLRTRASGRGPGVYDDQYKEVKVACLVTLQSQQHDGDPQPQPPSSLLLPRRVRRLVQQIHGKTWGVPQEEAKKEDTAAKLEASLGSYEGKTAPRKKVRTCVASMVGSHAFGPMVAAEAQQRGFYQAQRRAYLADGAPYNWTIQRGYFPDFEPIADFLHVLCYV